MADVWKIRRKDGGYVFQLTDEDPSAAIREAEKRGIFVIHDQPGMGDVIIAESAELDSELRQVIDDEHS